MFHYLSKTFLIGFLVAACVPAVSHGAAQIGAGPFFSKDMRIDCGCTLNHRIVFCRKDGVVVKDYEMQAMRARVAALAEKFAECAGDLCLDNKNIIEIFPRERSTLSVLLKIMMRRQQPESADVLITDPEYELNVRTKKLVDRSPDENEQLDRFKKQLFSCGIKPAVDTMVNIVEENKRWLKAVESESILSVEIDLNVTRTVDAPPAYSDVPVAPASERPQTPPPAYQ